MKTKFAKHGRQALDLVEEAVHLIRTTPARVWLAYYAGAIPFTLGLLFFWADMSCGAFARTRCPSSALGMVILFVWLKCWQAVFTSALRAGLGAAPAGKWTLSRVLRLVFIQGIVQPSRLFIVPLAMVALVPFGWVFAFYENITVLGDGTGPGVRPVLRRAGAQAWIWPQQNHMLLALLALVAGVLWLNSFIAVLTVPQLLKMFLGLETAFSRAGIWVALNTTFLAVTVALAWLALDPLVKAVYTLRCFHGEARKDGADLLAELSLIRAGGKPVAVAILMLLAMFPLSVRSAEATNPVPAAVRTPVAATPAQIDEAVKQTLQHDKYAWRLPRENIAEDKNASKGWLQTFFESIGTTFMGWLRSVGHWISSVIDWIFRHLLPKPKPVSEGIAGRFDWSGALRLFAYALLLAAAVALVLLIVRMWRQGWRRAEAIRAEVIAARPDLNDENVTAAQLPEDEWLKLARDLLNQGDLRLALRAFYLATLAHLAAREIVSISRFKSNRDYETEVNRRARGSAELRAAFAANVSSFDRVWYGLYDVTTEAVAQFQSNFERIRSC
ncbi:MAG TPA: DUF4129 domain-containing protein [Candidatus Acidoferrales bacterium]|nr:DUF4129 domain-containing protein [Candidatus Acidoferrales bacterium]